MNSPLLLANFNKYANINEKHFADIEKVIIRKLVKRKRPLLVEGEISRYIYFVEKGALRSYTIDNEGIEHVIQLALEEHWIGDLFSFITQVPGNVSIEAIEDSEVLLLPHYDLELLYGKVPALERYFRQLFQRAYVGLLQRHNLTVSSGAEQRYRQLIDDFPQISARIPLIYIASFLGITPESLSRIRRKLFQQ